ncbi:MAG TPA: hypothetical protein VF530_16365 [Planctomycetota bacterium]
MAWREDLATLARELPQRHVRPFRVLPEADFRAMVAELDQAIPALDDGAVVVELARLCAALGDGHTGFHLFGPRLGLRRHPLWLMSLSDGIYVKGVREEHLAGLNGRVVGIGPLSIDEVRARLAPLVPHENDQGLRSVEGADLTCGEVLVAIGAAERPERARFVVVDEHGRELELESRTLGADESPPLIVAYREGGSAPLAERLRTGPWASTRLAEGRALYLQYNACRDADAFAAFCAGVFAAADADRPERLIVDLRWNAGGDSRVTRALDRALDARPWLAGRILVLIGPATFSSGLWAAIDLRERHGARLVGEPTGGRPHAPGDVRTLVLPRSTLDVSVSTRLWQKGGARYADMDALEPDVLVTESAHEHFAGRDPVLEKALDLDLDP